MNVPCDLCGGPGGYHRGGTTYTCNACQAARRRLDDCPATGLERPTEDAIKRADALLTKALGPQP